MKFNADILSLAFLALVGVAMNLVALRQVNRMDKRLADLKAEVSQAQHKLDQIKTRYEADSAARARLDSADALFPEWPR